MESNLIELESAGRRGVIKAAPIANLRILINQREEELRNLHDELGLIEQTLARNSLSNPAVHIQALHGPDGIRQMLNNRLEAQSELLCCSDGSVEAFAGKEFMDAWAADFAVKKLSGRMLSDNTDGKVLDSKAISPDIYRITHAWDVYDDTVATYHWRDSEAYGVMIQNKEIAESQRQFFELLWRQA
jgi:sugar-specific transcriptional regulator TrmB